LRVRGFALSELLVALAVMGLIVGVLTALDVDYVGLARRVADIGRPFEIGARAEAMANADRCATPASVLTAGENAVVAETPNDQAGVLRLAPDRDATQLATNRGVAGATARPLRLVVESEGASRRSLAAVEVGDATVGVVAPRCDLREVCDFDAANSLCRQDEERAVAGSG